MPGLAGLIPVTATPTSGDWGSQKQRMLAGNPCIADDPGIAADWLRCALLAQEYNGSSPADPVRRTALLRKPFDPTTRRPAGCCDAPSGDCPGNGGSGPRPGGWPPTEPVRVACGGRAESRAVLDSARLLLRRCLIYRPGIIGGRTMSRGCVCRGAPRRRCDRTGARIHG